MPEYRLYCLDTNGRILKRQDFEAKNDADALLISSTRDDLHLGCEIWEWERKVATLPARLAGD